MKVTEYWVVYSPCVMSRQWDSAGDPSRGPPGTPEEDPGVLSFPVSNSHTTHWLCHKLLTYSLYSALLLTRSNSALVNGPWGKVVHFIQGVKGLMLQWIAIKWIIFFSPMLKRTGIGQTHSWIENYPLSLKAWSSWLFFTWKGRLTWPQRIDLSVSVNGFCLVALTLVYRKYVAIWYTSIVYYNTANNAAII